MRIEMKTRLYLLLLLIAGWKFAQAQDLSRFKVLSDSVYQTMAEYETGNNYQKDAILFMDLVAETHPYYVNPTLTPLVKSSENFEVF